MKCTDVCHFADEDACMFGRLVRDSKEKCTVFLQKRQPQAPADIEKDEKEKERYRRYGDLTEPCCPNMVWVNKPRCKV